MQKKKKRTEKNKDGKVYSLGTSTTTDDFHHT